MPTNDDRTLLSGQPAQGERADDTIVAPISETTLSTPHPEGQVKVMRAPRPSGAALGENERFAPREVIGGGGMGSVWRAYDKDLERDVAIKVLSADCAPGGAEAVRFTVEARITGQLEHPYIVPVYEFGTDQRGARFLAMRLVQGKTLEETINAAGASRLTPHCLGDLLQILVKICDAVSFAHSRGVIHRDLKPSNIMISDFGQVYVMDWGVARSATRSCEAGQSSPTGAPEAECAPTDTEPPGTLIGTPSYMAPEQLRGDNARVDQRTDVFALGATLYQILTGQPPRLPHSVHAMVRSRTPVPIPPPEEVVKDGPVPAELSRIAQKAMSTDAADRYASPDELKGDVERFLRGAWHLPRVRFASGSRILKEGDPGESAYIIIEGQCYAYRSDEGRETVLRYMGPGEVFGETAVFSRKPRSASVKAATEVELMVVTSEILSSALGLNHWMGAFVRALAERFREVDERLRKLERPTRRRGAR
jgi:eukaryotic-like serine/threonine-protein kinase